MADRLMSTAMHHSMPESYVRPETERPCLQEGLLTSTIYNAEANCRKALLGFIFSLQGTISLFYTALNTFSLTYPGSQKALVAFDDTETKAIILINLSSWLSGSFGLVPYGSHFKDGESIDNIGFDIFIWFLFLWLLLFTKNCCATLHIFLKIPITHVLPVGVAIFCLAVIVSAPYIEHQRPTIVSKFAKCMWKKITVSLRETGQLTNAKRTQQSLKNSVLKLCRQFQQGARDISTSENAETLPSSDSMELELRSMESGPLASP